MGANPQLWAERRDTTQDLDVLGKRGGHGMPDLGPIRLLGDALSQQ
jgi:hypothetical protein